MGGFKRCKKDYSKMDIEVEVHDSLFISLFYHLIIPCPIPSYLVNLKEARMEDGK